MGGWGETERNSTETERDSWRETDRQRETDRYRVRCVSSSEISVLFNLSMSVSDVGGWNDLSLFSLLFVSRIFH